MSQATDNGQFVHLHVHSHYSLLDGAGSIKRLVETAAKNGMKALALTDHGNMFGAVDFYQTCKANDIKPIIGVEAYISPTTRFDKSMGNQRTASYHMVLLAMNKTGFLNLKKLSSRSYVEGFYYKPRIDRELLAELNEGLICTTACLGGEVPQALLANDYEKALRIAGEYKEIFGPDRFFIEVQNQGMEEQTRINPDLVRIANDLGVGIVGTNDVHFVDSSDKDAHQVLTCVSTGRTLEETREAIREGRSKMHYPPTLYLRPPSEMIEAFREFPGAVENTLKIAEMCNVEMDFSHEYLPNFPVPEGMTDDTYLAKLCWDGLQARFGDKEIPDEYKARMERELTVIKDKGYSSYFLVVNDFVEYARNNSIPSAPRGSGVATLMGYALKIAEVDPLQYGLLFERFTDPQRMEAPDIDIDICQEGRPKVIQYVREKYGHVAQIITYGTLKAKAVLKDVGRVMNIPLSEVDQITKLIPNEMKMTIEKALKQEPDLKKLHDSDPKFKQMFEYAKRLEGLCRHTGVHAAGVIVADVPLEEVVPLYTQGGSDELITQWDGPTSEKAGLMKMDFLGLRTLTIIQRARELVRETQGKDVDPETIPLDDDSVYELFRNGHTDGVFQFESDGMKNILRQMKPMRITDLIAANAMYRPGPMELIPSYCARKDGKEEVPSVHEIVDDLLAETYGIMAYQEQVMQVLNRLGKLPLNRALTLIKAISKKKEKVIAAELPNFLQGAKENGITEKEAKDLFALIQKFAGYGFNKAHSTRYAMVAYQTAYFKKHYPREFLAATLTYECSDTAKVVQYMAESTRMGVKILPPDINACGAKFAVDGDSVRFGLSAVKGVGVKAIEAIEASRAEHGKYRDLYDFCEHVDLSSVNRSTIETLIKCGAFDSLGASRAAMTAVVDKAIGIGQKAAKDRDSGQMNLFGGAGTSESTPPPSFPDIEPWSESQLLQAEKETLGFYISSHPLVKFGRELTHLSYPAGVTLAKLLNDDKTYPHESRVRVGCMIAGVRTTLTKKTQSKMAMLTVEDLTGKLDAISFPKSYEAVGHLLEKENMVFLTGSVDRSRDNPQILIDEVIMLDEAVNNYVKDLIIRVPVDADENFMQKLTGVLKSAPGNSGLMLELTPQTRPDVTVVIKAKQEHSVLVSRDLIDKLEAVLGDQKMLLFVPNPVPSGQKRKTWGGPKKQPAR